VTQRLFLVNSRNRRFTATRRRFATRGDSRQQAPLLPKLRGQFASSLTRVLSRALEYSSRPPESVCGTGDLAPHVVTFLGSLESLSCRPESPPHHLSAYCPSVCPYRVLEKPPTGLNQVNQHPAEPILLRPHNAKAPRRCRNINLLVITYASRPQLRSRLTHGRLILPQETLGLRRPGF